MLEDYDRDRKRLHHYVPLIKYSVCNLTIIMKANYMDVRKIFSLDKDHCNRSKRRVLYYIENCAGKAVFLSFLL